MVAADPEGAGGYDMIDRGCRVLSVQGIAVEKGARERERGGRERVEAPRSLEPFKGRAKLHTVARARTALSHFFLPLATSFLCSFVLQGVPSLARDTCSLPRLSTGVSLKYSSALRDRGPQV